MIKTAKIDPKKHYNLTEMRELSVFYWLSNKNHISYMNTVTEDRIGGNVLKAKITGSGRGRDYQIKGQNIINYLEKKSQDENTRKPNKGGNTH